MAKTNFGAEQAKGNWICMLHQDDLWLANRSAELTSLRAKLIKIGAKVVSHGRYVTFQLAEVAVSRQMFADILMLIARLRAPPAPA